MDSSSLLQKIYEAYANKNLSQMQDFLTQLKEQDPQNSYIWRYESMLQELIDNQDAWSWKFKLNWKPVKCPHCGNYLRLTPELKQTYQDYQDWKTNTIQLTCETCKHQFEPQIEKFKSLYLYNVWIWKKINVNWKDYNITWIVQYKWTGKIPEEEKKRDLIYNEYLLVDEKGDMAYLSESITSWSWWSERETEFSVKVIPDFQILEMNDETIKTNKWNYTIDEIDEVEVTKILWENTKSYKVWETIQLYAFHPNRISHVLEKEATGSQTEVWIYEVDDAIFIDENRFDPNGPRISTANPDNPVPLDDFVKKIFWNSTWDPLMIFVFIFVIFNFVWLAFGPTFIFLSFLLLIFILPVVLFASIKRWFFENNNKIYYLAVIIWIIVGINWYFLPMQFKEKTDTTTLLQQDLENAKWYYQISFLTWKNIIIPDWKITYDYGGYKPKTKEIQWFRFQIETQEDLEALKNLQENIAKISYYANSYIRKFNQESEFINNYLLTNLIFQNLLKK